MEFIRVRKDEVIFRQGESSRCMYRIQSGRVGIFLDYGGAREKRLTELEAGRYFGEMGLLDDEPRSATAVALTADTTLQLIRDEDFALCFRDNPAGMLALLRQMSAHLRRISRDSAEVCRTAAEVVEAERNGTARSAALEHRVAKALGTYEAVQSDAQREEAAE